MKPADILRARLVSQFLADKQLQSPVDVVHYLGAVQAQDFSGAMWAVAQRSDQLKTADFLAAFNNGDILRTHVMRPTWHFVAQEDIVWLLDLTRDRLLNALAYNFKRFDLNDSVFRKANTVIVAALAGGVHMTRKELADKLTNGGVDVGESVRLAHIIFYAEVTGLICSGATKGKQQTYALLSERASRALTLDRHEALAELAMRYFTSHGPATNDDFAWWSGLTKRDAGTALDAVKNDLQSISVDGKVYWLSQSADLSVRSHMNVHFLPNYDEYIVAYENRDDLFTLASAKHLDSRQNPLFNNVLIVDGVAVGTWKKAQNASRLLVTITPFREFTRQEIIAISAAADNYGAHLSAPAVVIEWNVI